MRCYKIDDCAFFQHYQDRFGESALEELMSTYCQGPYQPLCKRLKYIEERGAEPPIDLCPDGYQAGTDNKIYP